ncbi:MAG TPA: DNA recombination protein RmuC [Smithellaceae bacterium]|nr:DNA recombination protein RmuC [Smithellaceae bacterium]HOM68581.1 DNA recombination protein RmuC [Smithellaceae bacterium]HOS08892.1 DNA recombination protein RmuC [Smithellaceae bacterium]HPD49328.1 DNA recombination protein RmuC [Smithellaceae bacterium]HPL49601.1 DNA recombination protein RmuC [Smithellaceae bacterium]
MEIFTYIIIGLLLLVIVLLIWQLKRGSSIFSPLDGKFDVLKTLQERTENSVRDEIAKLRAEFQNQSREQREELAGSLKGFGDSVEQKMENVRLVVDGKLKQIQEDNTLQLEKMRETVDDKLHATLETRLGEAFKLVSERLEQVQKGLGEMQSLASGVGDLKKVLLNVKTKGVLGEAQLGAILDQILTPAQYEKNVKTKEKSGDHVEYAIKIPSKDDSGSFLWLPIDAKFPTEDYISLIDAYEKADIVEIETYTKSLKAKIERFAKDISIKYIDPPNTTDFAIMFLPFEGLFAEVLRIPGLFEKMQREHKITITGPTTISAFLNSLQMGFRTLAIQKRSTEVWKVLGEVKTAFTKFGDTLDVVRDRLEKAVNTVDDARKKSKTLQGKLRAVEEVPGMSGEKFLEDESAPELE